MCLNALCAASHPTRGPLPPPSHPPACLAGAPAVLLHWRTGGSPDGRPALNWPCYYLAVETGYRRLTNGTLDTFPMVGGGAACASAMLLGLRLRNRGRGRKEGGLALARGTGGQNAARATQQTFCS